MGTLVLYATPSFNDRSIHAPPPQQDLQIKLALKPDIISPFLRTPKSTVRIEHIYLQGSLHKAFR